MDQINRFRETVSTLLEEAWQAGFEAGAAGGRGQPQPTLKPGQRCPCCGTTPLTWPARINPDNGHIEEW